MIVFDLRCGDGHVFEAWFPSAAAYDDQRRAGQVQCALCGTDRVTKALSAPAVAGTGDARSPAEVKRALAGLARLQAEIEARSSWVGRDFPGQARAMHAGEVAHRDIMGEATPAEARALADEGVQIAPLPFRPKAAADA